MATPASCLATESENQSRQQQFALGVLAICFTMLNAQRSALEVGSLFLFELYSAFVYLTFTAAVVLSALSLRPLEEFLRRRSGYRSVGSPSPSFRPRRPLCSGHAFTFLLPRYSASGLLCSPRRSPAPCSSSLPGTGGRATPPSKTPTMKSRRSSGSTKIPAPRLSGCRAWFPHHAPRIRGRGNAAPVSPQNLEMSPPNPQNQWVIRRRGAGGISLHCHS